MKLLMHMCCAPCSVYPFSVLKQEGFEIEGLFYNPNIHPYDEFKLRMENVKIFSASEDFRVNYSEDFRQNDWEAFTGSDEERCRMCYCLRFEEAAGFAASHGFDAFTTSLLVSPYQKHELIKELCTNAAMKYGVSLIYRDFRSGFRQGQRLAKEMGLYRQKYCGCIVSKMLQNS